jgi:hypothetical protein
MDARTTAALAAGMISALATLAAVRGLPLGGALLWLSPFPLFALAFAFGPAALPIAVGAGALVAVVSGGAPALALWLLLFALPASLLTALAARGGGALRLGLPFALLSLWPATLLAGAEFALSGEPGGLSGTLRRAVQEALARMGAPPDAATAALVETVVRLKPLALAIWFAVVTLANGAAAQGFVARRGLSALPATRWAEASLPRWYAPLAVIPALVAGLAPGEPGFLAQGLAMMLAVPLVLQGLAVVHVISEGRPARPVLLGGVYLGLVVFMLPAGLALAGLGLAEFALNLRARARSRGRHPGQAPPDD